MYLQVLGLSLFGGWLLSQLHAQVGMPSYVGLYSLLEAMSGMSVWRDGWELENLLFPRL